MWFPALIFQKRPRTQYRSSQNLDGNGAVRGANAKTSAQITNLGFPLSRPGFELNWREVGTPQTEIPLRHGCSSSENRPRENRP